MKSTQTRLPSDLTAREFRTFQLLSEGWRVKQVATIMEVCENYISQIICRGKKKLSAKSTAHAIAILFRKGILS